MRGAAALLKHPSDLTQDEIDWTLLDSLLHPDDHRRRESKYGRGKAGLACHQGLQSCCCSIIIDTPVLWLVLLRGVVFGAVMGSSFRQSFTKDRLEMLLACRAADLKNAEDRRAQMLLRVFGSDGGVALRRIAQSYVTPCASSIAELNEAFVVLQRDMRDRGDVSYLPDVIRDVRVVWREPCTASSQLFIE